jgi:hypothetical protein
VCHLSAAHPRRTTTAEKQATNESREQAKDPKHIRTYHITNSIAEQQDEEQQDHSAANPIPFHSIPFHSNKAP